jgi:hypothetical protein
MHALAYRGQDRRGEAVVVDRGLSLVAHPARRAEASRGALELRVDGRGTYGRGHARTHNARGAEDYAGQLSRITVLSQFSTNRPKLLTHPQTSLLARPREREREREIEAQAARSFDAEPPRSVRLILTERTRRNLALSRPVSLSPKLTLGISVRLSVRLSVCLSVCVCLSLPATCAHTHARAGTYERARTRSCPIFSRRRVRDMLTARLRPCA